MSVPDLVIDASAVVETLLGTELGVKVRGRVRGHQLHAPAHLDAEVLSALGRLHRASQLTNPAVTLALGELARAPIRRHPLMSLLAGAWERHENLRLVDALYAELTASLEASALLTTDARLARSEGRAELIASG